MHTTHHQARLAGHVSVCQWTPCDAWWALAYFGVDRGAVVVRLPSEAEDLPQKDAVAPDVTVRGELELAQTFWSIPTQHATKDHRTLSSNFSLHWFIQAASVQMLMRGGALLKCT